MIPIPYQCFSCKHYKPNELGMACKAFPNGIPAEIADMQFDHRKPFPDDQGIQWEAKDAHTKNPFDDGKPLTGMGK